MRSACTILTLAAFSLSHPTTTTTNSLSLDPTKTRRTILQNAALSLTTAPFFTPSSSFAATTTTTTTTPDTTTTTTTTPSPSSPPSLIVPKTKSVVVLGANGRTGRQCVTSILASQRPCIATTRSGNFVYQNTIVPTSMNNNNNNKNLLTTAQVDVSSYDSIQNLLSSSNNNNIGAVIFAASVSKDEDAFAVDRDGVLNTARCCIQNDISRLVILSTGSVSKPNSPVYQFLNLAVRNVMDAKREGEDGVRSYYSDPNVIRKGLGYTILRPGGLVSTTLEENENDGRGDASILELNQGDSVTGRVNRSNVAALCVNCLDVEDTFDVTMEVYERGTGKSFNDVFLSNLFKRRYDDEKKELVKKTGFERRGESWEELLGGLKRDDGHFI